MASSSLANLVATVVIVANSTPSVVADTAILNVVILFGSVLLRFGADRLMVPEVRLAAAKSVEGGREAGAKILSACALTAACGVLTLYFTPLLRSVAGVSLSEPLTDFEALAIAIWLLSEIFRLVAAEGHRSKEQFVRASATGFGLRAPIFLGITFSLSCWSGHLDRESVVAAAASSSLAVALIAISTISREFPWWRTAPIPGLRRMWRANTWMLMTTLAGTVVGGAHIWIAGAIFTSTEVAPYAFANTLVTGLAIISTAINGGLSPRIASLVAEEKLRSVQVLTVTYVRGAVLVSIVALSVLVIVGPKFATTLGGDAYRDIGTYLIILGMGQVISCGAGLGGWVLMAGRKYRFVATSSAAVALIMVASCAISAYAFHSLIALTVAASMGLAALPLVNNVVSSRSMGVRTDFVASRKRTIWES